MRYYTLGSIFLFLSLITILISFYYINLIRPAEKEIKLINLKISSLEDKIKINELEYAAHLIPDYLLTLEKIYFLNKYSEETNLNIIGIKQLSFKDFQKVIKIVSN